MIKIFSRISRPRNIFVFLGVALLFFVALRTPTDPDMGWHLQDGKYLWEHHFEVARYDIFSHSMPDFPLIMHEWVTDAAMFLIYSRLGLFALSIFFALVTAAAFLVVSWETGGELEYKIIAAILGAIASIPVLGVRPQMFNLLGLAVLVLIIFRFRKDPEAKIIYWIPLVLLVWVNLHGGFSVGLFFVGLFLGIELVKTAAYRFCARTSRLERWSEPLRSRTLPWPSLLRLLEVEVVAGIATLINPYGWRVYVEVFTTIFDRYAKANISEWMPVTAANPMSFQFLVYLSLLFILLVFSFRRIDFTYAALAGVFLILGFTSWRHMPIFLIVSTPFWVGIVERIAGGELLRIVHRKWALGLFLAAVVVIGKQQAARAWEYSDVRKIAEGNYPLGAVEFLRQHPQPGKMFNEYNWGGFLIWQYPEEKVYIDGRMASWRTDGFSVFEEFNSTMKYDAGWEKTFPKYDIGHALVYNNPANQAMFRSIGWQTVYSDQLAVIFVRGE